MSVIWITQPDNYDPELHKQLQLKGQLRMDLFESRGYPIRVVHSSAIVAGWNGGPRLWVGDEDLLASDAAFMLSTWSWDASALPHISAIARTIRMSDRALLNDGVRDPETYGSDKLAMCHFVGDLGIPVPATVAVSFGRYAQRAVPIAVRELDAPHGYVVKPRDMAMGFGVLKVDSAEQLRSAVDLLTPGGLGCIVQPFQANAGDLRVFMRGGEAVIGLLRVPPAGGYLANIATGGSDGPVEVPGDIADMCARITKAAEADYLCIDWLLTPQGPIFNEWMGVSAGFEGGLPEPHRTRVADALFGYIADRTRSTITR